MRLRYAFRRKIDTYSIIKYVNPFVRAGTLAAVDGDCVSFMLWRCKLCWTDWCERECKCELDGMMAHWLRH